MTVNQSDKATRFRALHQGPGVFVIPNPWDAGSARLLAGLGFQALATSSGAAAGILGRRDGMVTRDEALVQARAIVAATDLPLGRLEKAWVEPRVSATPPSSWSILMARGPRPLATIQSKELGL